MPKYCYICIRALRWYVWASVCVWVLVCQKFAYNAGSLNISIVHTHTHTHKDTTLTFTLCGDFSFRLESCVCVCGAMCVPVYFCKCLSLSLCVCAALWAQFCKLFKLPHCQKWKLAQRAQYAVEKSTMLLMVTPSRRTPCDSTLWIMASKRRSIESEGDRQQSERQKEGERRIET